MLDLKPVGALVANERRKQRRVWKLAAALVLLSGLLLVGARLAGTAPEAAASSHTVGPAAEPSAPRQYVCYRSGAALQIDGRLEEAAWAAAPWTTDFIDIEGAGRPAPRHRTRAKMLWDDAYFYVAARLEEPDLWATLTKRDTVIYYDNDFEVFIDPDGDTHNYYVQFAETVAGRGEQAFAERPNERVKDALRELYYRQRRFFEENERYAQNLDALKASDIEMAGFDFRPTLSAAGSGYVLSAPGSDAAAVYLRHDGKVWIESPSPK